MPINHHTPSPARTGLAGPVRRRLALGAAASALAVAFASAASAADAPLSSIYVFGDSMSDSGTYASKSPAGAGKFTTNPDPVWVEIVAAGLGLPTLTSHAAGGTNYAEGGARVAVTFNLPVVHPDIVVPPPGGGDLPGDFSRTPVVTQVDNFFKAGGQLDSHSLVIIQGGGNDEFDTQFDGRGYSDKDLQNLNTAATQLAAAVKRVKDAGAGTVVTESVPHFDIYNQDYKLALAAANVNVLFFDTYKLVAQIEANPARYGLVNVTDSACKVGRIGSYVCTPALYVTPDANKTYLFADAVHFTGAGQQMEAEGVLSAMLAPNTIGQLSYVAQSAGDAQRQPLFNRIDSSRAVTPGTWTTFGAVSTDKFDLDGASQRFGIGNQTTGLTVGADYALSPTTLIGGELSWSSLDGDFGESSGGFDAETTSVGLYARHQLGRFTGWVEADYGHTDFSKIDRRLHIGPAVFDEIGSTDGERFSVATGGAADLLAGPVRVTPKVSLRYDHGRIAGYAERGDDATQGTFGSQKLETLVASVAVRISPADAAARFQPYAEIGYDQDLLDKDRQLLFVSNGAPVGWTSEIFTADESYLTYGAGVSTRLTDRVELTAGVRGVADRGPLSDTGGFVGVSSTF